jgi:hypothetical protein
MKLSTPLAFVGTVLIMAACGDVTEPEFTGRWAAEGIELRASTSQSQLLLPCATVSPMAPLLVDSTGRFELLGRASHSYGSFNVMIQAQVLRDTIQAALTAWAPGGPPHTTHYVLVRNGDPGFEHFACLGSAYIGAP